MLRDGGNGIDISHCVIRRHWSAVPFLSSQMLRHLNTVGMTNRGKARHLPQDIESIEKCILL